LADAAPAKEEKPQKARKVNKDAGKKEDAHQLGIEFKKKENMAKWY